jgi:hypothetical protein
VIIRSHILPAGRAKSCATSAVIDTLGYRIEKNWLSPDIRIVKSTPSSHILKVFVGIETSSVFATAALTSGYGESSSRSLWVIVNIDSTKFELPSRFAVWAN